MEQREASRIYAVVEAGAGADARLSAALAAAEVSSVLIVPAGPAGLDHSLAAPLAALAQKAGAAALVPDDPELARSVGADGVHLAAARDLAGAYALARASLGARGIVGVDPGVSRHEAMTLAEAGADYVAFGAPAHLKDRAKARVRRDELVAWWAEIFEVPCVAFDVETAEEARTLAAMGADFIAVRLSAGLSPAAAGALVAEVARALAASAGADQGT